MGRRAMTIRVVPNASFALCSVVVVPPQRQKVGLIAAGRHDGITSEIWGIRWRLNARECAFIGVASPFVIRFHRFWPADRIEFMLISDKSREPIASGRDWIEVLNSYRKPSAKRSIKELAITIIPLIAFWMLALLAFQISYILALLLAIPAAGFLLRLFLIQHDCGHGSFFRRRATNDWIGRILGVVTLTPYDDWRRSHAIHHATTGNLDLRGFGDIRTLTVREYQSRDWRSRLFYRLYRHPLVFLGIGPIYVFLLRNRLPMDLSNSGWPQWFSVMATNAGIAVFATVMILLFGAQAVIAVHLPIVLLAATAGVWLFYIQHQFEDAHWQHQTDWDLHEAALHGSSFYDLPVVLQWMSANIGMHHVHHLCSRIPYYELPKVLVDYPELAAVNRITLSESFKYARLELWDEQAKKLISFRDI